MEESEEELYNPALHDANRVRWNASSHRWKKMHDQRGTWRRCHEDPKLVFVPEEMKYFHSISGKKVCVLGSGDNLAVFALAGMGAQVTSVDISQEQLSTARERAELIGLTVTFVEADVTDLAILDKGYFDVVYTGGHVAVWVSDLYRYYAEAVRILKRDGIFMINEYHPFRRIWKFDVGHLEIENDYYDRGPFRYVLDDDILHKNQGSLPSYEFHWRVSDFLNAVIMAGCEIVDSAEFGTHVGDWEGAPMQGLPENFMIVGRKK